ncbi:unnamed protein product [Ceutorhynchus assimilis]|uniref:Uncharacterized protein n=1 Tax=Ceutorhynchus assimilis TaxID=467358 RepID=A0A9N9MHC8_9CUCU|nr:unnamed protein product [Ceutorhynchus assimilis]
MEIEISEDELSDPYATDEESDYIPESDTPNDDVDGPDSDKSSDDVDGPNDAAPKIKLKTRKRKRNETAWKINQEKLLRNSGKAYIGRKNEPHTQRSVKPYEHTCRYKCSQSISAEERREIFQRFYALANYDLQNSFVSSCIKKKGVQRKTNNATTNKQFSTEIFLLNKRVYETKIKEAQIKQEVHHKKAEKALATKKSDVLDNKDSADTCVICFDLQQALPTPLIATSKVFYLRQLWTYNFCIHNLVTGKSHMYIWNETVASRGSQEIGSCLIHFINEVLPDNMTRIIAYKIHHKFLEPGHTFMECDQDFGIIEKVKRKIPQIFIPEHWRTVIQESSKKFTVHEMKRENFYSFAQLNQIISDPKKNTDNHVIKWREIQYFFYSKAAQSFSFQHKPTLDKIMPFYTCMCPYKTTGRPSLSFQNAFSVLNECGLKIKEAKWKNLQSLLDFIPPIYHEFYNNIQYEGKGNAKNLGKKSSSTSKQAIGKGKNKKSAKKPKVQSPEETEEEEDDDVPEDSDFLYSDDE